MKWRREKGLPEGYGALRACPPVVAVGAEDPLEDQKMLADYFRTCLSLESGLKGTLTTHLDGTDGLGGIHTSVSRAHVSFLTRRFTNEVLAASAPVSPGNLGAFVRPIQRFQ